MDKHINIVLAKAYGVRNDTPSDMLALLAECDAKASSLETGQDHDTDRAIDDLLAKIG